MLTTNGVERLHERQWFQALTIEADRPSLCETNRQVGGGVGCLLGRDSQAVSVLGRLGPWILECAALMGKMPKVAIERIDLGRRGLHRHIVRSGVRDSVFPGADVPRAPGYDNCQMWRQGLVSQFEAHLIVALAGAAVRDRVGIFEESDL